MCVCVALSSYTIQYMNYFYDMLRGRKQFPIIFLFPGVSYTCWVHNKYVESQLGFLVLLVSPCVYFLIYLYTFFSFSLLLQRLHIITQLAFPSIKLSFYAFFLLNVANFLYTNIGVIFVLMYVNVFQCLQRIWKKASSKWRGSCCSWSETLRLLPPRMTQMTCSSQKWQYPLHVHAFGCRSGDSSLRGLRECCFAI